MKTKIAAILAAAALTISLGACGGGTQPLTQAEEACDYSAISAGSDGQSLTVDDDLAATVCVLKFLGTSEAVVVRMDNTNSLMGVVEMKENGFTYSFTYHPDNGFFLTIEDGGDGEIVDSYTGDNGEEV